MTQKEIKKLIKQDLMEKFYPRFNKSILPAKNKYDYTPEEKKNINHFKRFLNDKSQFHIYQDGYKVTDEPKSRSSIEAEYGPIPKLESQGYRIIPADKKINKDEINEEMEKCQGVPKGANKEVHERCVRKVKEKGHDISSAEAICNSVGAGKKHKKYELNNINDFDKKEKDNEMSVDYTLMKSELVDLLKQLDKKEQEIFVESIKQLAKLTKKDKIHGGLADNKSSKDFNPKALKEGIEVELEHTNDKKIAEEIAMDHLTEDPDYYKKLKVMESGEDKKDKTEKSEKDLSKELVKSYMGFKKLKAKLSRKGVNNPAAVAASIGRKKYGKERYNKAIQAGKPGGKKGEKLGKDVIDASKAFISRRRGEKPNLQNDVKKVPSTETSSKKVDSSSDSREARIQHSIKKINRIMADLKNIDNKNIERPKLKKDVIDAKDKFNARRKGTNITTNGENISPEALDIKETMKRNAANKKRMAEDRKRHNEAVKRSPFYGINKDEKELTPTPKVKKGEQRKKISRLARRHLKVRKDELTPIAPKVKKPKINTKANSTFNSINEAPKATTPKPASPKLKVNIRPKIKATKTLADAMDKNPSPNFAPKVNKSEIKVKNDKEHSEDIKRNEIKNIIKDDLNQEYQLRFIKKGNKNDKKD